MARVRICGECMKPVRECICDEDEYDGAQAVVETDEDDPEAA